MVRPKGKDGIAVQKRFLQVSHTLGLLLALCSHVKGAERMGLDVYAGRPMAEAVIALSEQLGVLITYEDPPFRYREDVVPVSPGSATIVPMSASLTYDYDREAGAEAVIRGLMMRWVDSGHIGEFGVVKTDGIYNIIPTKYRNWSGELVPHDSVLDTRITLIPS